MKKEDWLLTALCITKFALPFLLVSAAFELHRDELLYYQQGQHPALGYLENPPLIGWLASVSSLFGGSVFWIKFWPALFGAATLWVTVRTAKELGGGMYAQLMAGMGILLSVFLRVHFLFQPNFLDVFFWSLGAFFLVRYINTQRSSPLFLLAISLAAGWYGKYSVLFFIAAVLLSLLLTQYRTVYLRKSFWAAAAVAVVLVLPNLIWQYSHRWPLAQHMQELRETQLQYLEPVDFLKEQFMMLFPVAFLWVAGLIWLLTHRKYRVLGFVYAVVIVLLVLGNGKGYYALGVYPVLLAAGGVWAERLTLQRRWLRYALAVFIILLAAPFVPVLLPLQNPQAMAVFNTKWGIEKMGLLEWEDDKNHLLQQDFADMLGWKELTQKAERLFAAQPDSVRASTLVYGQHYGLAGGLKYYATDDYFRDKVITDNGSFLLWAPPRLRFKHLVFIGPEPPEKDDAVFRHFASVRIVDSCTNPLSRQLGDKIVFFQNATDSARFFANKELNDAKTRFNR